MIAKRTLARLASQHDRADLHFTEDALAAIRDHDWPGNVRELLNAVKRAAILCEGPAITSDDLVLGDALSHAAPFLTNGDESTVRDAGVLRFDFTRGPVTIDDVERQLLLEALRHSHGNVSKAARLVGLNRGALRYRIERLNLEDAVAEIAR
jgi:two-component system NtrC family response regulator